MTGNLEIMAAIQAEKDKEIAAQEAPALNAEGQVLGEGKRFTFDVIETPSDPLR